VADAVLGAVVLQDPAKKSEAEKSQEGFFGWQTVLWASIPILLAVVLALTRRRKPPPMPHVTDADFEERVLRSPRPVLVHFYRTWSIGDAVMINQAHRIADRNRDALAVVWLDADTNPATIARYSHVETPAFLFFADGRCLFHCEGVVDEADVHREMWEAYDRHVRRRGADAASPKA
jgi:thioredoxin 1